MTPFHAIELSHSQIRWIALLVVQITVIAGSGWLVSTLFRRDAASRHAILLIALIALPACPFAAVVLDRAGWTFLDLPAILSSTFADHAESRPDPGTPGPPASLNSDLIPISASVPGPESLIVTPPAQTHATLSGGQLTAGTSPDDPDAGGIERAGPRTRQGASLPAVSVMNALLAIWAGGFLVLLARMVYGWHMVRRLRRDSSPPDCAACADVAARVEALYGVKLRLRIQSSGRVGSAVAAGLLRPTIYLPRSYVANLSPQDLFAVLTHEAAHIVRRDVAVSVLQRVIEAVYWPHPFVHVLNRRLSRTREEVCDNYVLQQHEPSGYAEVLLRLVDSSRTWSAPAGAVALFNRRWRLEERIAGLLDGRRRPSTRPRRGRIVPLAAVLIAVGVALAGIRRGGDSTLAAPTEEESSTTPDESPAGFAAGAQTEDDVPAASARELALQAHARAAAIDKLPRFCILAHAGTATDVALANPSDDPLENLQRALDARVPKDDWYRYVESFAWDPEHYLVGTPRAATDLSGDDPLAGIDRAGHYRWGTREFSGSCGRSLDAPARHVLRSNAAAIWRGVTLSNPNYVLATRHEFWWDDNGHINQHFGSGVPPAESEFRSLGAEEFDGETCDVVESPTRQERIWISRETGLIRGYLYYGYTGPIGNFHESEAVRDISGRTFASQQEYGSWYISEFGKLPADNRWQLNKAWVDTKDFSTARPKLLVRFRDFREIAPGIWWPFREDRVQGALRGNRFESMRSEYLVDQVRTDVDLTETVNSLQPKEGERVQDQRYIVPVDYEFRADRSEDEILELVNTEYQKRLEEQEVLEQLRAPIERMVGQPAPALPEEGFIGGSRPETAGTPYLLHFWATWCGPCKNDLPILKRLAEGGALIIGLHPAGTSADEVNEVMEEFELPYATFLETSGESSLISTIAGYPANIFPWCILVDAQGHVVAHGSLRGNGALIARFNELRRAADGQRD